MEPITVALVAAITAGVISGGTKVTEGAITDAYNTLKELLKRKFGNQIAINESIKLLETNPNFEPYQTTLSQQVKKVEINNDAEVTQAINTLLNELLKQRENLDVIGIQMQEIEAASIKINDVFSSGTGVKMQDVKVQGDIIISKIKARDPLPTSKKRK